MCLGLAIAAYVAFLAIYSRSFLRDNKVGVSGFVGMWMLPVILFFSMAHYLLHARRRMPAFLSIIVSAVISLVVFTVLPELPFAFRDSGPQFLNHMIVLLVVLVYTGPIYCTLTAFLGIEKPRFPSLASSGVVKIRVLVIGVVVVAFVGWSWHVYRGAFVQGLAELHAGPDGVHRVELPALEQVDDILITRPSPSISIERFELVTSAGNISFPVKSLSQRRIEGYSQEFSFMEIPMGDQFRLDEVVQEEKRVELVFRPGAVTRVYVRYRLKRSALKEPN